MEYCVSAAIVTYNSKDKIGTAIASVKMNTKSVKYKLYVIDNGSTDGTKAAVKSADSETEFIQNGANIGFGKAHNRAIALIDSKYHVIINPDIVLNSDAIGQITEYMDANPDVVMAVPKIIFPDGSEQKLPKLKPKFIYLLARRTKLFKKKSKEYILDDREITEPIEVDQCTGCFMIVKTDVFKALGGFDERFFMYMEDADLTLRAKQFGKTVYLPQISVIHEWERSSSKSFKYLRIHITSMLKFLWKHRKSK